jgi:hypothetical protein
VYVENTDNIEVPKIFHWASSFTTISTHPKFQFDEAELPPEFQNAEAFKWYNYYHVSTPKGYSTLFVHPFGYSHLPFFTLPAVVDTDGHGLDINFPFLIRKDFEGLIPKGTPIAQALPFKRENWKLKVENFGEELHRNNILKRQTTLFNLYRSNVWQRKEYR